MTRPRQRWPGHRVAAAGRRELLQAGRDSDSTRKPGPAVELAKQETDPFWRTYALALAQFANGERAEADAALKKLIAEDADDSGNQIASLYALRKEPEKMFEWLEHAWTTHDAGVLELLLQSFPARLQGRPALHSLRAKDRGDRQSRSRTMSASAQIRRTQCGNPLGRLVPFSIQRSQTPHC